MKPNEFCSRLQILMGLQHMLTSLFVSFLVEISLHRTAKYMSLVCTLHSTKMVAGIQACVFTLMTVLKTFLFSNAVIKELKLFSLLVM